MGKLEDGRDRVVWNWKVDKEWKGRRIVNGLKERGLGLPCLK